MTTIPSYLDMKSIFQVDIAVANAAERDIWLTSLSTNNHVTFSGHEHREESIRWVVKRGIRLDSLKIRDSRWLVTSDTYGDVLFGLDILSLRCIDLNKSSIRDDNVIWLARGCPRLAEICLSGCD